MEGPIRTVETARVDGNCNNCRQKDSDENMTTACEQHAIHCQGFPN